MVGGEDARSPGGRVPFIEIPSEIVGALGRGKRPPLLVTLNGHAWRTRAAVYGGRYYIGLTKEIRAATGAALDDEVEVELALDDAPREVELPHALAAPLAAEPEARVAFERLSYTARNEHAKAIASAKQEATQERRLEAILASLRRGPANR